jgi:hypothetical protein
VLVKVLNDIGDAHSALPTLQRGLNGATQASIAALMRDTVPLPTTTASAAI